MKKIKEQIVKRHDKKRTSNTLQRKTRKMNETQLLYQVENFSRELCLIFTNIKRQKRPKHFTIPWLGNDIVQWLVPASVKTAKRKASKLLRNDQMNRSLI